MAEAKLHIGPDLLNMVLGVGGDDPAAGGALDRQGVGETFHLGGVIDRHLFLRRQRQGGPVTRVFQSALAIGVERDFHFDQPVVAGVRLAGEADALGDVGQQGFGVELPSLTRGADEAVGGAAGVFRHLGPAAAT